MKVELTIIWIECNLPWYVHDRTNAPERPDLENRRFQVFPKSTKKSASELKAHLQKVVEWWNTQPEVIEWRKKYNEWEYLKNLKSFTGQGLNKPGTLIVIDTPEGEKTLLIGDINPSASMSGDDVSIDDSTIIKRYFTFEYPS